jgi:hypothetical protein
LLILKSILWLNPDPAVEQAWLYPAASQGESRVYRLLRRDNGNEDAKRTGLTRLIGKAEREEMVVEQVVCFEAVSPRRL